MRLSNRLWHAIAERLKYRTEEEDITAWAKIKAHARGKRHALIEIPLNDREQAAVRTLMAMAECDEEYFRFLLDHERQHNPDMVAT